MKTNLTTVWKVLTLALFTLSLISVRAQTQLIQNSGFETGSASPWIVGGGSQLISSYGSYAHSGTYYLWLGGTVNESDYAFQTITIPANATSASLSFYYNIYTLETGSVAHDTFSAVIRDPNTGALLATVGNWSNLNHTSAGNPYYFQQTFNLLSYAGRSIEIYFSSVNNSTLPTDFRVDDVTVSVSVPSCSYSISPSNGTNFDSSAYSFNVSVTTGSGCTWSADTGGASWITITSGGSGTGNGSVYYSVAANMSTSGRAANLTIAGKSFSVAQSGESCSFSISPSNGTNFDSSAYNFSVGVTTISGCNWSADTGGVSWITITSGSSGTGSGTVYYSVAANTSISGRAANLNIAGKSFSVAQSAGSTGGAAPAISTQPQNQTVSAGATATFTVAASGAGTLSYQWYFNGQIISGATSSTLTLNSVAAANAGGYYVIVSNPYGFATSATASLKLLTIDTTIPCYLMTVTPLPDRQAGKNNLVVVTHGWEFEGPLADVSWITNLCNDISNQLVNRGSNDWQVVPYEWLNEAGGFDPTLFNTYFNLFARADNALHDAEGIGTQIGEQIAEQGWSHVHLIGHSAGAGLIQKAAEAIHKEAPNVIIQTTFLDPFLGLDYHGMSEYGTSANWADNYFTYDLITGSYTQGALPNTFNVDVTWIDPAVSITPVYAPANPENFSQFSQQIIGYTAFSSHLWPHDFYQETVFGTETNCASGYGFALSFEDGGWNNIANNHEGYAPQEPCGMTPIPQNPFSINVGSQLQIGLLPNATSVSGASVSDSDFILSNGSQSSPNMKLKSNGSPIQPADESATATPTWLTVGLTISNAINFVQFDATFTDSNNAEGLLTVFWDTNQIGTVDERVVAPNLQTYRFFLPNTIESGAYVLGFRLDSFDNTSPSIVVTNVATGFVGVTQPSTLAISITNNAPMIQLNGATNYTYLIQSSPDLVNWTPVAMLVNSNGVSQFLDSPITNNARFYRTMPWSAPQAASSPNTYAATLIRSQNQCLTAYDSPSLSVTSDMTIEAWINLSSQPASGSYTIVSKSDENGGQQSYGLRYFNNGGTDVLDAWIYANGTGGSHATVPLTIPTNVWTHIAMVYSASAGTVIFYTNGIPVFTQTGMPNSIYHSTARFQIGAYDDGVLSTLLDAKVDDVRLWATVRTQAQINATMKSELTGTEPNLRAYWKLDNDFSDSTTNGNLLISSGNLGFENIDLPF